MLWLFIQQQRCFCGAPVIISLCHLNEQFPVIEHWGLMPQVLPTIRMTCGDYCTSLPLQTLTVCFFGCIKSSTRFVLQNEVKNSDSFFFFLLPAVLTGTLCTFVVLQSQYNKHLWQLLVALISNYLLSDRHHDQALNDSVDTQMAEFPFSCLQHSRCWAGGASPVHLISDLLLGPSLQCPSWCWRTNTAGL